MEHKEQMKPPETENWLADLTKPEVQEALSTLIQKLPQISQALTKAEAGLQIADTFVKDNANLNGVAEGIHHIATVATKKETLDSLSTIIDKLPRIAQTLEMVDRLAPFIENVATVHFLESAIEVGQVLTAPFTEQVQESVSILKSAKERAQQNSSSITIFGILKMLKDPTTQQALKFFQALLDILGERRSTTKD